MPVAVLLILAACGGAGASTATPLPTATEHPARVTPPAERPTLPPTFTPTLSPTPLPPTMIPSPTITPTVTPTPNPDAICATFQLFHNLDDGRSFRLDHIISLVYGIEFEGLQAVFLTVRLDDGEEKRVELPAGGWLGLEIPVDTLAGPGDYQWTFNLFNETFDELCEQGGRFTVEAVGTTLEDLDPAAVEALLETLVATLSAEEAESTRTPSSSP